MYMYNVKLMLSVSLSFSPSSLSIFISLSLFLSGVARKQIMSLYNGNFHKILLNLATNSPHREVQYNCAGIIGHLAMSGKYTVLYCFQNIANIYERQCTIKHLYVVLQI